VCHPFRAAIYTWVPLLTSIDVASEIIDVLVATKKHEILILSRKVSILYLPGLMVGEIN
jgi:hypothetical protein